MFRPLIGIVLAIALGGCQSTQEINLALVRDRAEKLKPYGNWLPTWCRVEARLTQPAMSRYRELLKTDKLGSDVLTYTWKARKNVCEVLPLEPSELAKNHKAFLDTAMCMILQVHFVNSPFSELPVTPKDIVSSEGRVQIRTANGDPKLGIFVDPKQMTIETRTKSRGTFTAVYAEFDREWLPTRIEQRLGNTVILLDEFQYGDRRLNGRRMPSAVWISAGEEKPLPHTQIFLSDCQTF